MQGMATAKLSPSAYALLGLLDRAPASGYELGSFAMRSIAHFWPITRTHVYGELNRLEGLGYVTGEEVAQSGRPDKRVYRLTAEGEAALDAWVNDVHVPPETNRVPALLKVFFGARMRPDRLVALVAAHRDTARQGRDVLAAVVDDLAAHHPGEVYSRVTALYGLRQFEATLAWLDEAEALLTGAPGTAPTGPGSDGGVP